MIKLVKWMNQSMYVTWLYLVIGIVTICFGLKVTLDTRHFLDNSISAAGIVEELEFDDGSYYPIVSFKDEMGEKRTFRSSIGCNPACHEVFDSVEILYELNTDSRPEIKSFLSIWFGTILLASVGGGFLLRSAHKIYGLYRTKKRGVT